MFALRKNERVWMRKASLCLHVLDIHAHYPPVERRENDLNFGMQCDWVDFMNGQEKPSAKFTRKTNFVTHCFGLCNIPRVKRDL